MSSVDCLDKAGITTLGMNMSGWRNEWRHVYSAGDAGKQGTPMASFIRNVIGDANGKIGVIHVEDPVNNAVRAAVVAELKRLGMNVFHEETVQANQGSYIAELQRMAGATTVALAVNGNEVLGILRDANAMNFKPNWTGSFWPTDEDAASRYTLYAGIKAIRNYSSTNAPAFEDYKVKATAAGHNDLQTSTTMALYGMGLAVGKALANAGPSPTREALGPGIEAITNYNNGITMTLSFGPGVRVADVGMWPLQCCNGDNTWRGIGDPKKAF
jgi:hypothetical protein